MTKSSVPTPTMTAWCPSCQHVTDPVRVYECGNCGTATDERRCADCNRFAGRREEDGCADCFEEVIEVAVITDHDGSIIRAEDYEPEGESLAARRAAERAEAAAVAERRRAETRSAQEAASTTATWADVSVGDTILPEETSRYSPRTLPRVLHVTQAPQGRLIVATDRFGISFLMVHRDDPVMIGPSEDDKPLPTFGVMTLTDGEPEFVGSPSSTLLVEYGATLEDVDFPGVPVIALIHARGNRIQPLAVWHDPEVAVAALDVLDATAQRLAEAQGRPLDPSAGASHVEVTATEWSTHQFPPSVDIRVGLDQGVDAVVAGFVNRHSSMSVDDPNALAYAVAQARALLPTLTLVAAH